MATIPIITTERLRLDAFSDADIGALAAILAEPDVTKTITANGSTPEKCRASASIVSAGTMRAGASAAMACGRCGRVRTV